MKKLNKNSKRKMSKQNQNIELENEIKQCIRKAVSKTNSSVFESLTDVFKTYFERPSHTIAEIKTKTTKQKGLIFEIFCKMYLLARGYHDVWLLSEIPEEVRKYLNMVSFDIGIDLVARIKIPKKSDIIFEDEESGADDPEERLDDFFYFPIQAKYRKPTKNKLNQTVHRVGWKEVSTFLALVGRTGPPKGWMQHIIMTNADNVCWRGKKTKKDKTYAKKTFEKCSNMFWINMASLSNGNKLGISRGPGARRPEKSEIIFEEEKNEEECKIIFHENQETKIEEEKRTINNLRKNFLDKLVIKK